MNDQLLPKLIKLGFSEYEAKAYIALLGKNPVSGYELAKQSGVLAYANEDREAKVRIIDGPWADKTVWVPKRWLR